MSRYMRKISGSSVRMRASKSASPGVKIASVLIDITQGSNNSDKSWKPKEITNNTSCRAASRYVLRFMRW